MNTSTFKEGNIVRCNNINEVAKYLLEEEDLSTKEIAINKATEIYNYPSNVYSVDYIREEGYEYLLKTRNGRLIRVPEKYLVLCRK